MHPTSNESSEPGRPTAEAMASPGWVTAMHRYRGFPANQLPTSLPFSRNVARTGDMAAQLSALEVYGSGFALTLRIRLRTRPERFGAHRLHLLMSGPGGVDVDPEERLLIGVEFADGRRGSTIDPRPGPVTDPGAIFIGGGMSGGDLSFDRGLWVTPLPPPGPLLLVVRCGVLGIAETAVELDGAEIARAASEATILWPESPPPTMRNPTPPRRPADGWFSRLG